MKRVLSILLICLLLASCGDNIPQTDGNDINGNTMQDAEQTNPSDGVIQPQIPETPDDPAGDEIPRAEPDEEDLPNNTEEPDEPKVPESNGLGELDHSDEEDNDHTVNPGAVWTQPDLNFTGEAKESQPGVVITSLPSALRTSSDTVSHRKFDNPLQEALVVTAESYLARGSLIQYDDTRLVSGSEAGANYRWQRNLRTPEDYTEQFSGYTNCAAFTYDVYYFALGFDITYWSTEKLLNASKTETMFSYFPTGTESAEKKEQVKQEFLSTLQPGDIIYRRYQGNAQGHAMLYVGDGMYIHSSSPGGGSYDYAGKAERSEPNGSIDYGNVSDYFDSTASSAYFFNTFAYGIVRPLVKFTGQVPAETQARVKNMQGIVAQKISTVDVGNTVNPGTEVTYTIKLSNINDKAVTLDVQDTIPDNTEYISGGATVSGKNLSWKVTVPARKTAEMKVKVRIKSGLSDGTIIKSTTAKAGGISVKAPDIYVRKTISEALQSAMEKYVEAGGSSKSGIDLLNEIYAAAGVSQTEFRSEKELLNAMFLSYNGTSRTHLDFNTSGKYFKNVAPMLYGGYYVALSPNAYYGDRIRMLQTKNLVAGDLLVFADDRDFNKTSSCLALTDGKLLNLQTGKTIKKSDAETLLAGAMGYYAFVVIRPTV